MIVEQNEGPDRVQNVEVLNDLLKRCCTELMRDYGVEGALAEDFPADDACECSPVAAIDFIGRDLRGTIGVRTTRSLAVETYRAAHGDAADFDDAEMGDWICELANQLSGRLKNMLRPYNVSFRVNVPRTLASLPADELQDALRSRFTCDTGSLSGYLDVMIARGVALSDSASESDLPGEGDLVLF